MHIHRRQVLQLACAAVVSATFGPAMFGPAAALDYPTRPVRLVVGFAAGGAVDIVARLIGQWLSEHLGQQVVIENRPGAGSNIAIEAVVTAPPEGYTLLLVPPASAVNPSLYDKLSYDFLRDIAPVAGIVRIPVAMVVNPAVPAKTLAAFIAYAKAKPGTITMGSGGKGSTPHVAGELFKMMAGVDLVHVPYRGEAPALTDLIAGQVQVVFGTIPSTIEYIRADKLRALAVTSEERLPLLPDVPPVSDIVPGYSASGWYGLGVPKRTPPEIVARLNREINAGLADPALKARFADLGAAVIPGTPAAFGRFIADETEKWTKVVKFSGVKPE
jgi:tripartite-type tricarboxylate transporter receptor subunit TctC